MKNMAASFPLSDRFDFPTRELVQFRSSMSCKFRSKF